jgi:hypothetical protein
MTATTKEASIRKLNDTGPAYQIHKNNCNRKTIILVIGTVIAIVAVVLVVVFSKRDTSLNADVPAPSPVPSHSADLVGFISSIALQGGDEFSDPVSYQSKALAYMEKLASQKPF